MNTPAQSKINYTALVTQLITIAFIGGLIPMEYMTAVMAIVGILMPGIIQGWRTFFTGPK